jgi:hypothetical protein
MLEKDKSFSAGKDALQFLHLRAHLAQSCEPFDLFSLIL